MKDVRYEILSELYRFLGMFSAKDLLATCKLHGLSGNLRTALSLLAKDLRTSTYELPKTKVVITSRDMPVVSKREAQHELLGSADRQFEEYILSRLTNKKEFPTKITLVNLAKVLGLPLKVTAKDSTQRVAKQLLKNIMLAGADVKNKALDLLSVGQDRQTQGWFDVIRKSQ
ncbi:MAG: hypothetical protein ABII79_04945 [bacterium]